METPTEVLDGFGAALRAGDAVAASALFSREGCFVTPDGTVIRGRREIRAFLQQMVDTAEMLKTEHRTILAAGDVVIGSEDWSMRFGSGSMTVRRNSRSTIVLARVEAVWRIAVADPWRA